MLGIFFGCRTSGSLNSCYEEPKFSQKYEGLQQEGEGTVFRFTSSFYLLCKHGNTERKWSKLGCWFTHLENDKSMVAET